MDAMRELNDVGDSYDSLLSSFRLAISDARREWSASLLCAYPTRSFLTITAQEVCAELDAAFVEVNAIYSDRQFTIATAPPSAPGSVRADQSLCVLTVGYGKPLAISDVSDGFVGADHGVHARGLCSWASIPILVHGEAAGTICALEQAPRTWTLSEQSTLGRAARRISEAVEAWLEEN